MKSLIVFTISILAASFAFSQTPIPDPEVNLTWTDNSDNEDGFEIERAPVSQDGTIGSFQPYAEVMPDVTTYTDTGIEYGEIYAYRVKAFNAFGFSGYTNVALGMAKDMRASKATMLLVVFTAPNGVKYIVDFDADGVPYLVEME